MKDVIQDFITEIILKAGIGDMPEDFKKDYTEKLAVEAQQRLGVMALSYLDEKGLQEFETLMQAPKAPEPKVLLEFFDAKIPDFTQKVTEVLKKFGEEFLAGVERLKGTKLN